MTHRLLTLLATLALVIAACGSGSDAEEGLEATPDSTAVDAGEQSPETTESASLAEADEDSMSDDSTAGGTEPAEGLTEPGADRSLVDDSEGPLGVLLFADTIDGGDAPNSARFEGRFSITGGPDSDLPGTFDLVLGGAYDRAAEASRLTMDMSELILAASAADSDQVPPGLEEFFTDPIEIITIGDEGWMQWGLLAMFTGQEDVWIELEADDVDGATEGFGFSSSAGDPTELLDTLAEADASLEDLGVETVNGVAARHWRAQVDLERMAADADPAELAELEEQFGTLEDTRFPMDVWIGVEDGLIYRYMLDLSSGAFFDDAQGDDASVATMVVDFFDYDEDPGIERPPADAIVSGDGLLNG